jgi:hypothetical protein
MSKFVSTGHKMKKILRIEIGIQFQNQQSLTDFTIGFSRILSCQVLKKRSCVGSIAEPEGFKPIKNPELP